MIFLKWVKQFTWFSSFRPVPCTAVWAYLFFGENLMSMTGRQAEMDQERRREKIRECWARGMRSLSKIAETVGCHRITVQRDLVILRRQAKQDPLTEEKLHLIREQIAEGYIKDIETLDELISQAREDKNIKTEIEAEGDGASDEMKQNTITKRKKITQGIDYNALSLLIQRKLEARRKLAELYQLLEPENKKLSITASAIASATAEVDLKGIPDADIIDAAKSVFSRIPSQN